MASGGPADKHKGSLVDTGDENANKVKATPEELMQDLWKSFASLTAQLAESNSKLVKRDAELDEMKVKLSIAHKKNASLEDSRGTLKKELREAIDKQSQLQRETSDLQETVRKSEAAMTEGDAKVTQLQTDLRDTHTLLDKATADLLSEREVVANLNEEIHELINDEENRELRRVKLQLTADLQAANDRNVVLETDNQTLTERLRVSDAEAQEHDRCIAHLKRLKEIHQRSIAALQSHLDQMRNKAAPK